jgi:hypothetical protein
MAQQGTSKALALTTKVRTDESANLPTHDEISARAFSLWGQRGTVDGSSEDDWHRAEQELRSERASTN